MMVVKKRPQSSSPDNIMTTMDSERSASTTTTPQHHHSSSSSGGAGGRISSHSNRDGKSRSSSRHRSSSTRNTTTLLPLHKSSQSDGSDRSSSSGGGSPPSSRRRRRPGAPNSSRYNNLNDDDDDNSNEDLLTLPTWSANPQSPGDNNNNNNHLNDSNDTGGNGSSSSSTSRQYFSTTQQYNNNRRTSSGGGGSGGGQIQGPLSSFTIPIPPFSCKWVVFGVAFLALMVAVLQSRGSLIYSLEEVAQLARNNNVLRTKLNDAEKGIKLLQREVSAYDVMMQQQQQQQQQKTTTTSTGGGRDNNNPYNKQQHHSLLLSQHDPRNRALEEMEQLSDRLQESQKRADRLKQRVQKLSTIEAKAKYGDHKHRVEIELSFPDGREGPTRFVIELAPLELMPHSVHFFLEMVSKELLDGCSFILNALHVLKAAPLPYDGSSAANKARAFTRMGLESVAFKEYAPSYPHEQYTVGFAADGSPSFYINTEDNSEIHLGDPCFGKIVEGFDTVKRLEASPTRNGIWFEQRIGIKKATVLM